MSLPNLIGVTGFKRSGKDTLTGVLVEKAGYVRLAFADALKEEVATFLGISTEELEADKTRWREVLQYHGCAIRDLNPTRWIQNVAAKMRSRRARDLHNFFVISDVRFQNEADWIKRQGGTIIRVVRDGIENADPSWHKSERQVVAIKPDYMINATTAEGCRENARSLIKEWRK